MLKRHTIALQYTLQLPLRPSRSTPVALSARDGIVGYQKKRCQLPPAHAQQQPRHAQLRSGRNVRHFRFLPQALSHGTTVRLLTRLYEDAASQNEVRRKPSSRR
jgi:hypothetical protein